MASGAVQIVQRAAGRVRRGTSEQAFYEVPQEMVILAGGDPAFTDSVTGTTTGAN